MNKLISKKIVVLIVCLVSGLMVLGRLPGRPLAKAQSSTDFSHVVDLEGTGDNITIQEVRGPSDKLVVGNTYEVRGSYRLVSKEKAVLALNVTVDGSKPHESHPDLPKQKIIVEKGEGSFTLQFHLWTEGNPHVSFYPVKGGHGFASRYF
ncbi:MAG TPA: hypothetical protein VGK22_12770 [Candidatus Angelobacter sp.]|jgi:hypothetical protein